MNRMPEQNHDYIEQTTKSEPKSHWRMTRKAVAAIATAACVGVVSVISVVAYQQHWIQGMFPKSVMDEEISGLMDELSTGVEVSVESDLFDVEVLGAAADERELIVSARFTPIDKTETYPDELQIAPGYQVNTRQDFLYPNGIQWDYSERDNWDDEQWFALVPDESAVQQDMIRATFTDNDNVAEDGSYSCTFRVQLYEECAWSEDEPFQIRLEAMNPEIGGKKYGNIGTLTANIDTAHLSDTVCVESDQKFGMGWATYTVADHTTITPFGVTFSGKTRIFVSPSVPQEITLVMKDGSELVLKSGSYGYASTRADAEQFYTWDAEYMTESVINPSEVRAMIVRDQEIPLNSDDSTVTVQN